MKRMRFFCAAFLLLTVLSIRGQQKSVVLETTMGDIRVVLYDDTPLHRDNFLKLVGEQFYDSLLFHRVIKGFMIQAGDPDSRHAQPGATLGEGEVPYTLPAELFSADGSLLHYHQRGTLAMAREADEVNPERRSSGCQFYIVWGKTCSSSVLEKTAAANDQATGHQGLMTPEMMDSYRKIGGAPHLDGQYTVFGEVTEGLDVVKRIQLSFTDDYDRPVDDVRILRARIVK